MLVKEGLTVGEGSQTAVSSNDSDVDSVVETGTAVDGAAYSVGAEQAARANRLTKSSKIKRFCMVFTSQ